MYPDLPKLAMNRMLDKQKKLLDSIINPVQFKPTMKGRFMLRRMKGEIILEETAWCPNLLLNQWFDHLFVASGGGIAGFLAGAGTSSPLITNTTLQSYLGGGNQLQSWSTTINSTVSPRYIKYQVRYRSLEGGVVGNVTEVGLYRGSGSVTPSNSQPLINRARVVDEFGSPTSVTVLADEFLELVYEIFTYAIEGATGTLTISKNGVPTNYGYEIQPINMAHSQSWFTNMVNNSAWSVQFNPSGMLCVGNTNSSQCHVTAQTSFGDPSASGTPAGYLAANSFNSKVMSSYVAASRQRTSTIRLPLNNGNIASPGIRSINLSVQGGADYDSWSMHQVLLDGPFIKVGTELFDLPVNVTMGNTP